MVTWIILGLLAAIAFALSFTKGREYYLRWKRLNSHNQALSQRVGELEAQVADPAAGLVRTVFGEEASREICAEVRQGAELVKGIWCSSYSPGAINTYFQQEANDLYNDKDLHIERIINPTVLDRESWVKFRDLWARSPEWIQKRWDVKVNEKVKQHELFITRYPPGSGRPPIGILTVNRVGGEAPSPEFALELDPRKDSRLRTGVDFIESWFADIAANSEDLTPEYEKIWDEKAAIWYDRLIWNDLASRPQFFQHYVVAESQLLIETLELCADNAAVQGRLVTLLEVGCGTGRALLPCATRPLNGKIEYLIGLDSSRGMLTKAEDNLGQDFSRSRDDSAKSDLLRRIRLCLVEAEAMHLHFRDGALLPPPEGGLPATALSWQPDGAAVQRSKFQSSQKVFACMLNTLGVIPDDDKRGTIVANMVGALGVGDYLVVSVLSAENFAKGAREFYPDLWRFTRSGNRRELEKFDDEQAIFRVDSQPAYYSRWFYRTPPGSGKVNDVATLDGIFGRARREVQHRMDLSYEVIAIEDAGYFVRMQRLP